MANSKQQNNNILTDITNNINVSAMKKEVKIAIVAIVGIMLLFFGMTFLKGLDLFSSNKLYKIRFSDISGLSTSTPIYADGYKVGVIKDIHYDFSKQGEILAEVGINEAMPIPQGTRAEIASDLAGEAHPSGIVGCHTGRGRHHRRHHQRQCSGLCEEHGARYSEDAS